jgi:uncharacterized protein YkwD
MSARSLWGIAAAGAASCALAALCAGPPASPPPAARAPDAPEVGAAPRAADAPGVGAAPRAPAPGKDAAASGRSAPATAKAAPAPAGLDAVEAGVLAGVNRHRRAAGLGALRSDPRLAEIARAHSRAMAAGRRGVGHGGFDERSRAVETRVTPYRRFAENVARHPRRRAEVASAAVAGWLRSSGHRHNIEGPYSLTGVGAAASSRGEIYLTQIFVEPR